MCETCTKYVVEPFRLASNVMVLRKSLQENFVSKLTLFDVSIFNANFEIEGNKRKYELLGFI